MKRGVWIFLIVLGLLLLAGLGAARWYLTSNQLAQKVTIQLEAVYGGKVAVGEVDVWLGSSSLGKVELYEKDCPQQTPWLSAEEIQTDRSVFDLLRGNSLPGDIKLKGVKLLLRFDKDGRLITCLPANLLNEKPRDLDKIELPQVRLENCQVTLRKEGAADLTLDNIHGALAKEGKLLALSGKMENPRWGHWNLTGKFSEEDSRIDVYLQSDGPVKVHQDMLDQIPFIPARVWSSVRIHEGATPGMVKLSYDPKAGTFSYRIELSPSSADLSIPSIELEARQAQGQVIIENNLVELRRVSGHVFGGTLDIDANLDFRSGLTRLEFPRMEAKGLDVEQFPKSWKFPPKITGKLEGRASLQLTLLPGPKGGTFIQTEGSGKARIVDARVLGNPTAAPIELALNPIPGGYAFGGVEENCGDTFPTFPTCPKRSDTLGMCRHSLVSVSSILLSAEIGERSEVARLLTGILLAAVQEKGTDPPKKGKTSYFDIDLKMKDLDLAKFAKELEVKLPFDMAGRLSFQVKVSIPLDQSGDLTKYKVHGTAQLRDFVLGDLRLQSLETEITFLDGVLRMPRLEGRMPPDPMSRGPGTFAGVGAFQVEPLGHFKFDVKLDAVPLSQIAKLSGTKEKVEGDVSGTLSATAPGDDLKNSLLWSGSAKLSSSRVAAFGWKMADAVAALSLRKGELRLDDLQARIEGAPVSASAQMKLEKPYAFTGRVKLDDADLAAVDRLNPSVRPPVTLAGKMNTEVSLQGTLEPLALTATGTTRASDLKMEKLSLKNAEATWELTPDELRVKKLQADLYEGAVSGVAVIPLKPGVAGTVELSVKGLDAGKLAKDVPLPVKVQGRVDGRLEGTLPATEPDKERPISVQLDLKADKLRVQNIPTEQLKGSVDYKKGVFDYRLEGKSLGGTFELEGQMPPAPEKKEKTRKGQLSLRNIQIGRLLEALGVPEATRMYEGALHLELSFTHPDRLSWPEGAGRLRLTNLRYKDTLLASDVIGDIVLTDEQLRLRDFSTTLGEGIVRAQVTINLKNIERSWFTIHMDRVEIATLLGPWVGDVVKGELQARIRGKLGREWTATADLEMARVQVAGVEFSQWRMPLTFRYAPAEGRGEIAASEINAQTGAGRVTGKFSLGWDYTLRLDGQLRFSRVNVESLLRQTVGGGRIAGGLMTGRFDFSGRDMRSLDDLSGALDASFEQSQALEAPVLKQLAPFLGVSAATTFQKGNIKARLGNGLFRIQHLDLEGATLKLFAEGTVSLQGRLDLDVMATTANFGLDPRLRLIGLKIPLAGPVPVVVITEAAALLSNRVLQLRVTGAVRSPTIRVLPLATLTQGAVRFFLERTLPTAGGF